MNIDYSIIGQRIKNRRREKNITIAKLAEILDVSEGYVGRLEKGTSSISLKRALEISEVLEINIGELLTGVRVDSSEYLNKELYEILTNCSPKKQKLIYSIAKIVEVVEFV